MQGNLLQGHVVSCPAREVDALPIAVALQHREIQRRTCGWRGAAGAAAQGRKLIAAEPLARSRHSLIAQQRHRPSARRFKVALRCADRGGLVRPHDLAFAEANRQPDLRVEEYPQVVLVRCVHES